MILVRFWSDFKPLQQQAKSYDDFFVTAFGKLIGLLSPPELQVLGLGPMYGVQGASKLGCQKMGSKLSTKCIF